MLRFVLKLAIFALIAAAGSFWATERFGKNRITQKIAKAVTLIVTIGDLTRDPGKYDGSLVQISGRPVSHAKLAALGFGGIVLEDESGNRLIVLVKSGIRIANPTTWLVTVVGVYKHIFEIDPNSYAVLLTSNARAVRGCQDWINQSDKSGQAFEVC